MLLQAVAGIVWGAVGWLIPQKHRSAAHKMNEARLAYRVLELNTPKKHRNNVLKFWDIG